MVPVSIILVARTKSGQRIMVPGRLPLVLGGCALLLWPAVLNVFGCDQTILTKALFNGDFRHGPGYALGFEEASVLLGAICLSFKFLTTRLVYIAVALTIAVAGTVATLAAGFASCFRF